MRLIDADALEQEIDAIWDIGFTPEKVSEKIRKAPTIDAEPVVRCENCKWAGAHKLDAYNVYCSRFSDTVRHFEYCSYGVHRGGAING